MESGSVFLWVSDMEKFLDSKPWLDSELEDEFFIVRESSSLLHSRKNAIVYQPWNRKRLPSDQSCWILYIRFILCCSLSLYWCRFRSFAWQRWSHHPNGSPAPATEAGKRKKLGEHFRESIIWEGRASDDEDNSQVKPRTHVLVYPNKSLFGSPKKPTHAALNTLGGRIQIREVKPTDPPVHRAICSVPAKSWQREEGVLFHRGDLIKGDSLELSRKKA